MTVIVYRNGEMAADSGMQSHNGLRTGTGRKIARGPDGALAGSCGNVEWCDAFLRWFASGRLPERQPKLPADGMWALVAEVDGTVKVYVYTENWYEVHAPFHARGSGAEVAMGALGFGATAEQAVAVVIEYDSTCTGPILVEKLD